MDLIKRDMILLKWNNVVQWQWPSYPGSTLYVLRSRKWLTYGTDASETNMLGLKLMVVIGKKKGSDSKLTRSIASSLMPFILYIS